MMKKGGEDSYNDLKSLIEDGKAFYKVKKHAIKALSIMSSRVFSSNTD